MALFNPRKTLNCVYMNFSSKTYDTFQNQLLDDPLDKSVFSEICSAIDLFFSLQSTILNQTVTFQSEGQNTVEAVLRYLGWEHLSLPIKNTAQIIDPLYQKYKKNCTEVYGIDVYSEPDPSEGENLGSSLVQLFKRKSNEKLIEGFRQLCIDLDERIKKNFEGYLSRFTKADEQNQAAKRLKAEFTLDANQIAHTKLLMFNSNYEAYIKEVNASPFTDHPVFQANGKITDSSETARCIARILTQSKSSIRILPYLLTAFVLDCTHFVEVGKKNLNSNNVQIDSLSFHTEPDTNYDSGCSKQNQGKDHAVLDNLFIHTVLKHLTGPDSYDNFSNYLKRFKNNFTYSSFLQKNIKHRIIKKADKVKTYKTLIRDDSIIEQPHIHLPKIKLKEGPRHLTEYEYLSEANVWEYEAYLSRKWEREPIHYQMMYATFLYSLCVIACMKTSNLSSSIDYALSEKLFNWSTQAFYTILGPISDSESAEFRSIARIAPGTLGRDGVDFDIYEDNLIFYDNELYAPLKVIFDDKRFWKYFKTMSFARNEHTDSLLECGIDPDLLPDELNDPNEQAQANAIVAAYLLHPYNKQDFSWDAVLTQLRIIHTIINSDFGIQSKSE